MKRHHDMPFGAVLQSAAARFRLWAPGAQSVALNLSDALGPRQHPMEATGDGWYTLEMKDIGPDARYLFRIDDRISVPDPASRYNPEDVHYASALIDPLAFEWPDSAWTGRPWEEAVVYELHIGTFTPEGTFNAAIERLDYLVQLGVTAVELMPVADFPGRRNWGYDGVLPFAPDASYGRPEDLKSLVAAAHARGLMMLLDVVYNHFGPEGNYLSQYAPQFFDDSKHTPWGAAINFGGEQSRVVRDFFIHNALYWLEEFNFDGLRLDAVHAIVDDSKPDFITELSQAVRNGPGQERHVHIVLENDRNQAHYLGRDAAGRPALSTAQWNDDFHHALHVIASGERDGYYTDYAAQPLWQLGRALAEGYAYQGESSPHRNGEARGERSAHLPPSAFVNFLQNHDQIGNRALGERLGAIAREPALRLGIACMLLAPQVPMLFMGEEFAASTPFVFFCDFAEPLAGAVREGRRREFASFERFRDGIGLDAIPDATDEETFLASKLKWSEALEPGHRDWHTLFCSLLELRRTHVVPHLAGGAGQARFSADDGLAVDWTLPDGAGLHLRANFSDAERSLQVPAGDILYVCAGATPLLLPPWSGLWTLDPHEGRTQGA